VKIGRQARKIYFRLSGAKESDGEEGEKRLIDDTVRFVEPIEGRVEKKKSGH